MAGSYFSSGEPTRIDLPRLTTEGAPHLFGRLFPRGRANFGRCLAYGREKFELCDLIRSSELDVIYPDRMASTLSFGSSFSGEKANDSLRHVLRQSLFFFSVCVRTLHERLYTVTFIHHSL